MRVANDHKSLKLLFSIKKCQIQKQKRIDFSL